MKRGVCRECGCSDGRPCGFLIRGKFTALCSFVEDDLCSACIPDIAPLVGGPRTKHRWVHPTPETKAARTKRAADPRLGQEEVGRTLSR